MYLRFICIWHCDSSGLFTLALLYHFPTIWLIKLHCSWLWKIYRWQVTVMTSFDLESSSSSMGMDDQSSSTLGYEKLMLFILIPTFLIWWNKFVAMCKWSKSLRKVVDWKAWTGLDSQVQTDHTTCIEVAAFSYFFVEMWKIFITISAPQCDEREMTPMSPLTWIMVLVHLRAGLSLYVIEMVITRIQGSEVYCFLLKMNT